MRHTGAVKKTRPLLIGLSVTAAAIGLVAALWLLPWVVVDFDSRGGPLGPGERQQAIAAVRQGVLFAAGGLIAIVTLAFTWRRDRVARQSAELDRDANFTSRYTEAITQLGSDSVPIRLGGMYALERIAKDSLRDRQTILDVLAAYLRHVSPYNEGLRYERPPDPLPVDIAASALVMARISRLTSPDHAIDLSLTRLPNANMSGANFTNAVVVAADLRGANLAGISAALMRCSATLLRDTNLSHASLVGVQLRLCDATGAKFAGADLRDADLRSCVLTSADLSDSNLTNANLEGCDLQNAKLARARLTNAHLEEIRYSRSTVWPEGFTPPDSAVFVGE